MPHERSKDADWPEGMQNSQGRKWQKQRLRNAMWRDFLFLVLGGIALHIVGFVETNANNADIRGATANNQDTEFQTSSSGSIVDAGFILTAPLYRFLEQHRIWNDMLALLNSLALIVPTTYAANVTFWHGDYTLAFRLIATQLFRSFCGWFTYLPPSEEFLLSLYDFPEVAQCFFQDCSVLPTAPTSPHLPFVSFFSGHVACCVIAANHMYIHGYIKCSLALHFFNVIQIIRLLATRGHYSIDIIIGWCVAVFVSNPAERVGRYYSHGLSFSEMLPANATHAFETITGVHLEDRRNGIVQSDTTARIAAEAASDFARRSLSDLREDLIEFGLQMNEIKELRRNDLMRLLQVTQLKLEELRSEAMLLHLNVPEGQSRRDLIHMVMERLKQSIDNRLRRVAENEQD